ncbi:MAG: sugar transferase [Pseudomonadota bacterium]
MSRSTTLILAGLLLIVLLPVMVALAMVLWCSGTRRVLYCDRRVGQHGRLFTIWKFRTMRETVNHQAQAGYDQARVTRLGRWLRRYRLDELPQLINVLRGDLNLVGMRPPLPCYVAEHPGLYADLLGAKPGLTGLASVRYHKVEDALMAAAPSVQAARSIHAARCLPIKARLDRFYLARRSLGLDLWILLQTCGVVLPNRYVSCVESGRLSHRVEVGVAPKKLSRA